MIAFKIPLARFVIVLACIGGCAASAGAQSHVRIQVANTYGDLLSPSDSAEISVSGNGGTIKVHPDTPLNLGRGRYVVKVSAAGFDDQTEEFDVDQNDQILTVTVRIGSIENIVVPSCILRGTVSPSGVASRIRLINVFGSFSKDVAITKDSFEFRDLQCGDYVLLALDGKKLMGVRPVRATVLSSPVTIDLPDVAGGSVR